MKNVIRLVTIFFMAVLFSCQDKQPNQLVINGTVKGISDQNIILKVNGTVTDTTAIIDGKFTFTKTVKTASVCDFALEDKGYWILPTEKLPLYKTLLVDNGANVEVTLFVDSENPRKTTDGGIIVEPRLTNREAFMKQSPSFMAFQEFSNTMNTKFYSKDKILDDEIFGLNIDWNKVGSENEEESLGKEVYAKLKSYRKQVRESRVEREDYLESVIANKGNELEALFALNDMMCSKIKPKELKEKFPLFLASMSDEMKNTGLGITIKEEIDYDREQNNTQRKFSVGKPFKDFTAPNQEGKQVALSSVMGKGKYILLDFWASWCSPCRGENPNVLKMYNKYHDKGLEVVAYSLDHNEKSWLKAIKDDGMPWIQLSDLNPKSQIIKDYGITGIPMNYLIDGETGLIIDKMLIGKELSYKLDKVFVDK